MARCNVVYHIYAAFWNSTNALTESLADYIYAKLFTGSCTHNFHILVAEVCVGD